MHGRPRPLLCTTAIYGLCGVLLPALGLILLLLHAAWPRRQCNARMGEFCDLAPIFSWLRGVLAPVYFGSAFSIAQHPFWTAAAIVFVSALNLIRLALLLGESLSALILGRQDYGRLSALTLIGAALSIGATPFPLCFQFQECSKVYVLVPLLGALLTTGISIWLVV